MKTKRILTWLIAFVMIFTLAGGTVSAGAVPVNAETTIENLTVNYQNNAYGVDVTEDIRFSWNMKSDIIGQGQKSYEIKLYKDSSAGIPVWESGVVNSAQSVGIPYAGAALELETGYYWTVTVVDQFGNTQMSEPDYFETGCDFTDAKWIIPNNQEDGAVLLRAEQTLTQNVDSARLYISSLGIYTAYINGEEIMAEKNGEKIDDIFNPGWTDYKYYLNYQTYNVTDYISEDSVVLGVMLGKGWYGGDVGDIADYETVIGDKDIHELALLAKLVITYEDGTQKMICTNNTNWKSSGDSPVTYNDFYHGEEYDANIAQTVRGWNDVGYNDSAWDTVTEDNYSGELKSGDKAAARISQILSPASGFVYNDDETVTDDPLLDYGYVIEHNTDLSKPISLSVGDKLILNMGQNMVGVPEITVSGAQNTKVAIRFGEMLNDGRENSKVAAGGSDGPRGSLYTANIHNGNSAYARATDYYTLSDEAVQTYQPYFTFHGYQYVEISADSDITIYGVKGMVITSVGKQTGFIETSDPDINQLVSNTMWSQRGNYLSIPTDCPQRGERCGWTGDAQLFAQTGLYNFDVVPFMENYIEIMNAHAANNGDRYSTVIPVSRDRVHYTRLASGWSDAGIIIPWVLYQQTGDLSMIKENYSQMDAYMDVIADVGYGDVRYGDWLAFSGASTPYLNAVYQIYTAQLMGKMADVIGNNTAKAKYDGLYETYKTAFMAKYVDENGNVFSSTADGVTTSRHGYPVIDNAQTALLWALKLELYQDEAQRNVMIANLLQNIRNEDGSVRAGYEENTLSVGFLGVNVILPVLTDIGCADVAYELLLQDAMPSWLYSVKNGATTIWERWNSYSIDDSFGDSGMNSFNHYSYGACLEWMYEYMAGINADENNPGFQNITLSPTIDQSRRITFANASYESGYGTIESKWSLEDSALTYNARVPANTSAILYLPSLGNAVFANGVSADKAKGVEVIGMTERNGQSVLEMKVSSGSYEFTSSVNASFELAAPDVTGYEADEAFDVLVTVPGDSANVKIVNETGMTIGKLGQQIIRNGDGTKTYRISIKIGTPGERTLSALVMPQIGGYQNVGATLDVMIAPPAPLPVEDIISVAAEESAGRNEAFTVTIKTSADVNKIKVTGETGGSIGILSSGKSDADGTRTWTITIKVGTKGDPRTFTVLGAKASGGYGTTGKSFSIKIM